MAAIPDVKVTQGHDITAVLTSLQNVIVVVIDNGSSSNNMRNDDVTLT